MRFLRELFEKLTGVTVTSVEARSDMQLSQSAIAAQARATRLRHLIAVTQIAHDTPGRVYYQRKIAEGKTKKRKRCAR